MKIYNKKTGQIVTEIEFRKSYPNTSFPARLTREILQKRDHDVVAEADAPVYDNDIEELVPGPVVEKEGGYQQTWLVKEKSISQPEKSKILAERQEQNAQNTQMKLKEALTLYIYNAFEPMDLNIMSGVRPFVDASKQTQIDDVFAWVQAVRNYYYQIQDALGKDPETTWDFSIFDETKPADPLKSLVKKQ